MTLKGFFFILVSALFHVLWNTSLKQCRDKTSAVLLMMVVTVAGFVPVVTLVYRPEDFWVPAAVLSALGAGFFFFLYQYFVARAYETGDLTLAYPLSSTGPVYIVFWSYLLIGERISFLGAAGICLILYGAVTLQIGRFLILGPGMKPRAAAAGALPALAAAFFYSFGAIADKIGVMSGSVYLYTGYLCVFMLAFHCLRMAAQHQMGQVKRELRESRKAVIFGGIVMLLSFITFRIGLEEAFASYASALRQVSTLFGMVIGFMVFRERLSLERIVSSCLIVAGAILIKLG